MGDGAMAAQFAPDGLLDSHPGISMLRGSGKARRPRADKGLRF